MSRAEHLIYQQRAQAQKLSTLQTKLKQEFHEKEFAVWQSKGKNLQIKNQLKNRLNNARAEAQRNLNERRHKLAILLEQEQQMYKEEILASQETPQKIKQKMSQRVKELKQEKEVKRKDEVNAKLDKRFNQNADELRKVDKELKELKTAYERNLQLVEKQNKLQDEYEEEMLFAELAKRDIRKKEEAERLKIQQQKQKLNERNAILAMQKEMKERKAEGQKMLNQKEKQMLRYQWEKQSQLERMKEKQQIQRKKEINKDIFYNNERQKQEKEEKAREEKLKDRQMIERIVAKEREIAEYEKLMKDHERGEAQRLLKSIKNRSSELAVYEKQLDKLIDEERKKIQRKQDEAWEKKEKARLNMLYQVFDDRERRVKGHLEEKQQQKREKELDRNQVQRKLKEYEAQEEKKRRDAFERGKVQQHNLLAEIAAKEEKRRMLMQELHRQEVEMERGRKDYERRIEERKTHGREELEVFKKTNRLY